MTHWTQAMPWPLRHESDVVHIGTMRAPGKGVRGRYEQLAATVYRVGHPELEQCMVYWEGRFDPHDLNRALCDPDYLRYWHGRCAQQAEAVALALLARVDAAARRAASRQRLH